MPLDQYEMNVPNDELHVSLEKVPLVICQMRYMIEILRMQNQNDTFLFKSKRGENQGKQSKCAQKWPQDGPEPPKPSPNGAQDPSNSDF